MENPSRNHRHLVIVCLIALFTLAISGHPGHGDRPMLAAGAPANLSKPDPAEQGRVLQSYGKLPLAFEANVGQVGGQTDAGVKFLSRGAGYTLFLTGDGAVLEMQGSGDRGGSQKSEARRQKPEGKGKLEIRKSKFRNAKFEARRVAPQRILPSRNPKPESRIPSVVRMQLIGANPNAPATGADELPGKSNYFIGNDPKKWRTNVPTYAKVKYAGVYPGVDLVYYGNQGQLEYDFVVAPGADPSAIRMDFGVRQLAAALSERSLLRSRTRAVIAADPHAPPAPSPKQAPARESGSKLPHSRALRARDLIPRLAANGDLVVKISGGEVRFHKPVVYQPNASSSLVAGHYKLTSRNQVSFEIGPYDPHRPMVIDPALSYSTYLGGSGATSHGASPWTLPATLM